MGIATHAMVFAKLIIDNNNYGIAPFLVQLRDLNTFKHMKGVKTGDLGPKLGYTSKNNGWATFDNVRIPRDQMCMRFISVDKEGTFSIESDMRLLYGVMMSTRTTLVAYSFDMLGRAILVSGRYSSVRRQFKNTGNKEETKLIDYQTQQMKMFPLLASCFTFIMSHDYLMK